MQIDYNKKRVQTKNEWIRVFKEEEKREDFKIILKIFKILFNSKEYTSRCGLIAKELGKDIAAINLYISKFGKRVIDFLDLEEIYEENGTSNRWNIPFETDLEANKATGFFTWKLRSELVEALKEEYNWNVEEKSLDNGVRFALANCEKTLDLINQKDEYKELKKLVIREYYYLRSIKYTGNMYEHFTKYRSGKHKYAEKFRFLKDYGIIPNEEMADYLQENFPEELNHFWKIEDMIVGHTYTNNEIASTFKCSNMGGMRRSIETNSLVLIAKHINPLYDDQWTDDGILNYTGMGTTGDQSIEFAQNKTLAIAKSEGIKVYLFESYKDNEYYYNGEVELADAIKTAKEKDINGNVREVIKFPLKLKEVNKRVIINEESLKNSIEIKEKEIKKIPFDELKNAAKNIENKTYSKEIITTYRDRNPIISQYTKRRANGYCDLCDSQAPFKNKSGEPYLETHHIITLADGGPDVIYNTVALCPNCHRRMHVLKDKNDLVKLIKKVNEYIKQDNSEKEIQEYNKLFNKYL